MSTQGLVFGLWFCVAVDPGDCLSPVLVCFLPLLLSKDFRSGLVSDGFQTKRRGSWILEKEQKGSWRVRSRLMEGRNGRVNSARRCYRDIPAGLHGKYRQAVAARNGEWSTGSSTSSGGEDRRTKSLEAENKELRARVEARKGKESKAGKDFHPGEKAAWRKSGEWRGQESQKAG